MVIKWRDTKINKYASTYIQTTKRCGQGQPNDIIKKIKKKGKKGKRNKEKRREVKWGWENLGGWRGEEEKRREKEVKKKKEKKNGERKEKIRGRGQSEDRSNY